ncbi:MAG: ABC transporter permease [Cyclobacteriaceae bacterium]|nr:ABC transporter permease [Cyclobacteriaceae bacterium]
MMRNYFLLTVRNLVRNPAPYFINLIGMSIALACCITAYVNYEFNVGFDKGQKQASQLYRIGFVNRSEEKDTPYGVAPMPMGALLRENSLLVDAVIRYISKTAQFRIGDEVFETEFVYADPDFTRLFTMERLFGTLSLESKSNVIISDRLAITYFGTVDAVGKPLTQLVSGKPREFIVGGVYRAFPSNSSFRFDLISTFDNYFTDPSQKSFLENDWTKWSTIFLHVKDPLSIRGIEEGLQQYVITQNEARPDLKASEFFVEPFIGMAHRAVKDRNQGHWFNRPMPPAGVLAPFLMAGFLLLVACFNFNNNSIALAGKRLKEIGIRKVVGGLRRELMFQFLAETLIFCFLALGVGLFLSDYFVAGWSSLWPGISLKVTYFDNLPFFSALLGLILITALLAGGYPAFYLSSFRPIQVLRDRATLGGMNWLTKSMLVVQFSISLAALIFAIAFYFNSRYQRSFDLGYAYRSVIQVPVSDGEQFARLRDALQANPSVSALGGSAHHIYSGSSKTSVRLTAGDDREVDLLDVGENYFQALDIRVLYGRGFEKDKASDFREAIVVNEEFVRKFQLTNPVGTRVMLGDTLQTFIVGVVKDVYLAALFQPISAVVFRYVPESEYRYLVASTNSSNLDALNEQIKVSWKKLFPNALYPGRKMEERMVMAMDHFDSVVIIYTFLGLVAIIMSVSGLFGLVSLNLQKRTKELGIRKILGAPGRHILLQASRIFLVIMIFSCLIGGLAGSFMVNALMDSVWEYYVAIDFNVIFLAILIIFLVASVTISSLLRRVAVANPVESLRHE